jgi:hypothetical protein
MKGEDLYSQMKSAFRNILFTIAALGLFCPPSYAGNNKALLIGISQYTELDCLRYADADVKALSEILIDFAGYKPADVTILLNQQATKSRIVDEINRAVRLSKKEPFDHFILMFAGHGGPGRIQNRETGIFLAPSDASTAENTFYSTGREVVNETFINRAWLARQLSSIDAKSIVLILDSCYSGARDFGNLFIENLGYEIQSFSKTGSQRGVAVIQKKDAGMLLGRKIAFLASSREDQPSAEYSELRHGALSYCIFENIKEAQRQAYDDERKEISVESIFSNVTKLFGEVKVQGVLLAEVHQPILFPIPNYNDVKDLTFVSVQGIKKREILKGVLEITTDPQGAEVFVDGVKIDLLTNCRLELTEGKHHITLFLPNRNYGNSFTADIHPLRPEKKHISMRGALTVESFWLKEGKKTAGPKLDVYLDGKHIGKTGLQLDNLVAGTYTLRVNYEKVTKTRNIEIRPLSPLLVNYTVIRQAAPKVDQDRGVGGVVF